MAKILIVSHSFIAPAEALTLCSRLSEPLEAHEIA